MKVRAERAPLADALTWVVLAISKNPPALVLAGVHLVASGGELTIKAFDYERSHVQTLAVDVASEGEALVSGHFLRAIVAAMKGTDVELALDGGTLTISCGRATYRTQEMAAGDYPTMPTLPAVVGKVDATELQDAVGAVKHPLDTNAMVAVFGGIRLEGAAEGLTLVGMDRSHVARAELGWSHSTDLAVTVPGKALEDAVKGMEGLVTVGQHEGVFGLSDSTRAVTVRTIAEEYPKWRVLFEPLDGPTARVDTDDLRDALRRTRELDRDEITVGFGDEELTIQAGAEVSEGVDVLSAETDGETSACFNPGFVGDILTAVPDGPLSITTSARGLWGFAADNHPNLSFALMVNAVGQSVAGKARIAS